MFRQKINPITIQSKIIFTGTNSILSLVALSMYFIYFHSAWVCAILYFAFKKVT